MVFVSLCLYSFCFFFFKQKTAYEMRISDWSSDVCSSDLALVGIVDESLAVEFVGARPRHGGDRHRTHLVELGLVVRGDDTILADRELWERVALGRILTGNAVLEDIILLSDTIDEDVDATAVLRAALQARIAIADRKSTRLNSSH